jgi:hypothetical protein
MTHVYDFSLETDDSSISYHFRDMGWITSQKVILGNRHMNDKFIEQVKFAVALRRKSQT